MVQPRTLVLLYQYFHPDEVVSARLFSDLAQEMAAHGWRVVAMPASRDCHHGNRLPLRERWGEVAIQRIWRPGLRQATFLGRIINAAFMLIGWSWRALVLRRTPGEVMVVGTDPILGVLAAVPWRLFRPGARIIHWCHDVHPEAIIADGGLSERSIVVRLLRVPLRWAYRSCDAIVDLGGCMRRLLYRADSGRPVITAAPTDSASRIEEHDDAIERRELVDGSSNAERYHTLTPWALIEPPTVTDGDPAVRHELFGTAALGCLYSGNLGRAHEFDGFLKLARLLQSRSPGMVGFCFAGRGARLPELKVQLDASDENIRIGGFASEDQLQGRLAAGDIHLVSLRQAWTGTVVPSKFFGALAIGRPILFAGSAHSAVAGWIKDYKIGWHLTDENVACVAEQLIELARMPEARHELNLHCFRIYHEHFSKERSMRQWHKLLRTESTA